MSLFGIDYATPGADIVALKKAGVKFVCRYLAPDASLYRWKRLTGFEVKQFRAVGIVLVTVFESSARRARGGFPAGKSDAVAAATHAASVGLHGPIVYFAVDYDAPESDQPAINRYLEGAASILGADRIGVYGGYHVVKRCLDANVCVYAWQTYAWSGGNVDKRAHLYQYSNGHELAGVSCDYNRSLKDDFGQYPRLRPYSPEQPNNFWTWARWWRGHGEFKPYGPRNPVVRPDVPRRIPVRWWARLRKNIGAK